jgi:hypothetical protein
MSAPNVPNIFASIYGALLLLFSSVVSNGNSGTAFTVNWNSGAKQKITLTGNCTFTFTAPPGVANILLMLTQDGTGSRTATWPASVKWTGAAPPTLTTTAGATDIVTFFWDGTNYWGVLSPNFA